MKTVPSTPSAFTLTRCLETTAAPLQRIDPPAGEGNLAFSGPSNCETVQFAYHASVQPLTRALNQEQGFVDKRAGELLVALTGHRALMFVSTRLAYNLLAAGWARGIRTRAMGMRLWADFTGGTNHGTVEVPDLLPWQRWAVAKPSEAAAGGLDPCELMAEILAPLAGTIQAALSGQIPFALIHVRGQFTLPKIAPDHPVPAHGLSAENIHKALLTFDRFYTSQHIDRIFPIEAHGLQSRMRVAVRTPDEQFPTLFAQAMADFPSLTDEQVYYVVGVLLRGL